MVQHSAKFKFQVLGFELFKHISAACLVLLVMLVMQHLGHANSVDRMDLRVKDPGKNALWAQRLMST